LKASLLANGLDLNRLTFREALDVAEVLVATRRAIPPQKWIDSMIDAAEVSRLDGMF